MTPKQIAEKYVQGHHDALTDEQEKRDMAADIEQYANEKCREITLEAKRLRAFIESWIFEFEASGTTGIERYMEAKDLLFDKGSL